MNRKQITEILNRHGFYSARMISHSKSGYRRRHPEHFVVFNAKLLTRRDLILQGADLDLTIDADELTAAAREAGENFYVLHESHPHFLWEPGSMPMSKVLSWAVWQTRIEPADADVFLPVERARRRPKPVRLIGSVGRWQNRPAYKVCGWENDEIYHTNMMCGAVDLFGHPPKGMRTLQRLKGVQLFRAPAPTRGRPVRPVFYQRTGRWEYVWFSHGAAISAPLYDHVLRPLGRLHFTIHRDHQAIHVRKTGQLIGLIWPASIGAPDVVASAHQRLGLQSLHRRKDASTRLGVAVSDHVVHFARLLDMATKVFGDLENAKRWLNSPQFGLGGAVPLDYAKTDAGAREVENLLGRIEYGLYS